MGAAVFAGVLEEGDEVADADDINARGPQIRVGGERGEDHEAPVAAAVYHQLVGVYLGLTGEPVSGVGEVRYGVHPLTHVVQVGVSLAVTGRATHIGGEHGVALAQQILGEPVEVGAELGFGAAVNYDDGGYGAFGGVGWLEVPGRDLARA